jgi:ribosomal protein L12E/L44/L45/RPP1/RPP2
MNLGRLLVAAVLLAGLSGAVWWSNKREKANEGKPAPDASPKILTLNEESLRQIEVKHRNGEPTVVKKDDSNRWSITAPKPLAADQASVASLTSGVANLGSERVVDDKLTDLASYGLAPAAIELNFTTKDGKTSKLLIGDDTPTGSAVYANVDGDPRLFTMAAYNKNTFDKTYKDLRDKRLMTFDQDKISRVELTAKKGPIEFGRIAQNEWQILKPKPLRADGFQVEELVRKLKDANMDTSVSDDDAKKAAAAFGSAPMVAMAKVTDASGTQTLEVHKSKDDYYAKSSVVEGIYKVNKDLGDGLDKSADDFRNKKIFDFGFSDPNRIEFKDGAQSVVASKSGEKWMSAAGKELDSTSVQAFIDKVRDLSASKFPESSFGMPAIELTVVSNDGKRTEKVQIAPTSTANFLARREGEPALYELEANTVQDLRKAGADVREAPPPAPAKKK